MSRPRRPWWVIAVIVAYLLVLAGAIAFCFAICGHETGAWIPLVVALLVILLAQASLLLVPVQLARGRPITRGSLWVPLLGSGFLLALLVLGAAMALLELFRLDHGDWTGWGAVGLAVAYWAGWCGVFWWISVRRAPGVVALWLHRWILAGSALELVVAVAAHIVVRRRTECCAGIWTGFGIACGIAVALAAFGPAVVLLFMARWQKIQIPKSGEIHGFEVVDVHPVHPDKELPKA